jgi:hypothetical protein
MQNAECRKSCGLGFIKASQEGGFFLKGFVNKSV